MCHPTVISGSNAKGQLFFVIEYYAPDANGEERQLRSETHPGPSREHAISYAKAVLEHVLIHDKKPHHLPDQEPGRTGARGRHERPAVGRRPLVGQTRVVRTRGAARMAPADPPSRAFCGRLALNPGLKWPCR